MIHQDRVADILPSLRASARKIALDAPPLTAQDVAGLFILQAEALAQPYDLRCTALTAKALNRLATTGVAVAIEADDTLLVHAGFITRWESDQDRAIAQLSATYLPWRHDLWKLAGQYETRPRERPDDPRAAKLLDWYQPIMRQTVEPKSRLVTSIRRQLRLARSDEEDVLAVLARLIFQREVKGKLKGLFRLNEHGRVTVGSSAVKTANKVRWTAAGSAGALPENIEDARMEDGLDAATRVDLVRWVRDVAAARRADTAAHSARAQILSNLLELLLGAETVAALARRSEFSESALRQAFDEEREVLRKRLGTLD